jgi:hypothetical protein
MTESIRATNDPALNRLPRWNPTLPATIDPALTDSDFLADS